MILTATPVEGAYVVDLERLEDERGFFARTFCRREFRDAGLDSCVAQCNVSYNRLRGTLRGMHWQAAPHEEAKLVRVTRGVVWDAIADVRVDSPTGLEWFGVELSAEAGRALYIPPGVAHGFITLTDDAEVFYQMSQFYEPSAARGARWDDPALGIEWPLQPTILHPRDASYPDRNWEESR